MIKSRYFIFFYSYSILSLVFIGLRNFQVGVVAENVSEDDQATNFNLRRSAMNVPSGQEKIVKLEVDEPLSKNSKTQELSNKIEDQENSKKLETKEVYENLKTEGIEIEAKYRELNQSYYSEYMKLYNNYYQAYLNWYNTYYLPHYNSTSYYQRFPYNDAIYDMNKFLPPMFTKNNTEPDGTVTVTNNDRYSKPYMTKMTQSPPAGRVDVPYVYGHPVVFNAASSPYMPGLINPFSKSEKELSKENSNQAEG